jgi:KipI family sensor histidine kinase inhibitor
MYDRAMEAHDQFRVLPVGDGAFVLELGKSIDPSMSQRVLALHNAIMKNPPAGLVSSQPTFLSISIQFDPQVTDADTVLNAISKPYTDETSERREPRRWKIPACYDPSMGLDCNSVADQTKLEPSEYARRHSDTRYLVYMLGGFPGYPFMGDVANELRVPRLKVPRTQVPPGSIAVAGQFTAIYPRATPGGWCIVGRTPVDIFDTTREQPALFSPGDEVSFSQISPDEFDQISSKLESGEIGVQTFAADRS